MAKVLVTGGAGFIGSNFIRYVLNKKPDWQVVNLDKLTYAGNLENLKDIEDNPRYIFIKGDISDRKLIDEIFVDFDIVVNFAAESHVDRSILDSTPFVETNVLGTQVLLEAIRHHKVLLFIQISTDEVYGSIEKGKFTEKSPLKPNSPYSASKASSDLLCRAYYKTYRLPVIITRSSNNYGPYQFPEKFIPLIILNALAQEPLPIYGDGQNVRDWLYVEDNCRAILAVIEKGEPGQIYNIGAGEERRNIEVARLICEILAEKLKKPVDKLYKLITFVKDRPGHDYRYSLDCEKIRKIWSPTVSFEEGLRKTVDWYLTNQDWVKHVLSGEYQNYYRRVYEYGWK